VPTFPYTPGFVHGEQATYTVQVNRFQDLTEQRYLLARQRGFRLAYDFPFPSSSLIAQVASFYQAQGGPLETFTAVDHRDGTAYTVRFAAPTFDHVTGPIGLRRALRLEFIVDQGGTTPVATTYEPPPVGDFCDPVVPTSGVVAPTDAAARDGWPWIGTAVVDASNRYLPLGGFGGPTPVAGPVETALPRAVTMVALTLRVLDIGSAGSVRLGFRVNNVPRSELEVLASASGVTAVVTGTITTSNFPGTMACLVASLGTTNPAHTGATIAWGVGYTHPY
jgi:hypothetical protein